MFTAHEAYGWLARMRRAMPAQLTIEDREQPVTNHAMLHVLYLELRPMVTYGPTYQRSVADHAARALSHFNRERGAQALYWLEQACEAAAELRAADPYDPAKIYAAATTWGVSCTLDTDMGLSWAKPAADGATLNVYDAEPHRAESMGGTVIYHPLHHGRQFRSKNEASAYALRMGLLKPFVSRFKRS
jgi:hypothetical protein